MSLEQQIEEAWEKRFCNAPRRGAQYEQFKNGAKAGIEIGRREALRELYVEVKSEDLTDSKNCWIELNGEIQETVFYKSDRWEGGGFFYFHHKRPNDTVSAADAVRIIVAKDLPSPSSVFGGGA